MQNLPFKTYANCQLVKGTSRSTVCDLQRNRIHVIPLILHEILLNFDGKTIEEVKAYYGTENANTVQEYFDFLIQEEIVFFTKTPERFPSLSLQWFAPNTIQNCIVDIHENSSYSLDKLIAGLNTLGCESLEIRGYSRFQLEKFESILLLCEGTTITSISLIVQYYPGINASDWHNFADRFARITNIVVHSAEQQEVTTSPKFCIPVNYITNKISSEKCCGIISEERFLASMEVFTESMHYNTCLNGKVSIDASGEIKNCPSMKKGFGNIESIALETVVNTDSFKEPWKIKKDDIAVCKVCEFRHVCTDCRAYIEDPDDYLSKPLKCGYDPFSCRWEEWSNHPLKQAGIDHYQLQEKLPNTNYQPH